MTDNEVNGIISEFMDEKSIVGAEWITNWCKSLDALVPVWEKLKNEGKIVEDYIALSLNSSDTHFIEVTEWECDLISHMLNNMKSIQQAAAHATAKAIKELEN